MKLKKLLRDVLWCGVIALIVLYSCKHHTDAGDRDFRSLIFLPQIHADKGIYKADSLAFTGNFEQALLTLTALDTSAYKLYRQCSWLVQSNHREAADSLILLIQNRNEDDELLRFFRNLAIEDYLYRYRPGQYDLKILKEALPLAPNSYYKSIVLKRIGRYFMKIRFDLDSAWQYYQDSWSLRNNFYTINDASTLNALSELCTYKRKNLLAIAYANRMADFDQYYHMPDSKTQCLAYTNRAFMLFREGEMDGSLQDLELALQQADSTQSVDAYQELYKTAIILNMINNDMDKVNYFMQKLQTSIERSGEDYINIHRLTGRLAAEAGQTEEAIVKLRIALQTELESGYDRLPVVSNLCHYLSAMYLDKRLYQEALDMMAISRNINTRFDWENFIYFLKQEKDYSFVTAQTCAEIFFKKYKDTGQIHNLFSAEKLIAVIDSLMPAQWNAGEESAILQFYMESGADFYDLAIEVYYELYQKTKDNRWQNLFFAFCEKNKNSLMVRDYLLAGRYASIPEKWIEEERRLKSILKESLVKGLRNNKQSVYAIENYEQLENRLAKEYPAYLDNPLLSDDVSAAEMQGKLSSDQCILHFNETNNDLYAGVVTNKKLHMYKVPLTPNLTKQMDTIRQVYAGKLWMQPDRADSLSYHVFTCLFDAYTLKMLTRQWIVIPDGYLFRFPLAGLVYSKDTLGSKRLLDDYRITYAPAVRIMKEAGMVENFRDDQVAFFAFSDKETILKQKSTEMPELPGTLHEAEKIRKYYPKARIYTGRNATRANFLKIYRDSTIRYIHLAVHGLANSSTRDNVKLYFRTASGGIDSLYGYELLSVRSRVQKVVLSACQSGLGRYQKGEGTYSLPRYFIINGATDVTASLWDLDDRYDPTKPNVGMVRWGW